MIKARTKINKKKKEGNEQNRNREKLQKVTQR